MIVVNLMDLELIKPGTWVGVRPTSQSVTYTWRVHDCVIHQDHVLCWNPQNNQLQAVRLQEIQEVDGMSLDRFCEQADLNAQGVKKPPRIRRGRKPKHMLNK